MATLLQPTANSSTFSYADFVARTQAQPDLQDLLEYARPVWQEASFVLSELQEFTPEVAQRPHNRETARQLHNLLQVELLGMLDTYLGLDLQWRNTHVIKEQNAQHCTSKDVLLQNFQHISALVHEIYQNFQRSNQKQLLSQNHYLAQKSMGLEPKEQLTNQFDYASYQKNAVPFTAKPKEKMVEEHPEQFKDTPGVVNSEFEDLSDSGVKGAALTIAGFFLVVISSVMLMAFLFNETASNPVSSSVSTTTSSTTTVQNTSTHTHTTQTLNTTGDISEADKLKAIEDQKKRLADLENFQQEALKNMVSAVQRQQAETAAKQVELDIFEAQQRAKKMEATLKDIQAKSQQ